MDFIRISESSLVLDGLRDMMEDADEAGELVQGLVPIEIALLTVAVAKAAPDNEWFPRGKWATIQAIEDRIDREIAKLWKRRGGK